MLAAASAARELNPRPLDARHIQDAPQIVIIDKGVDSNQGGQDASTDLTLSQMVGDSESGEATQTDLLDYWLQRTVSNLHKWGLNPGCHSKEELRCSLQATSMLRTSMGLLLEKSMH